MTGPFATKWRSYAPPALAATLSVLLLVLAFLQHRWLVQVSEAERDRAHAHVESAAVAFAREFNEPLSRLAFDFLPLFHPPGGDREEQGPLAALLMNRLERWRGTAAEPELLQAVWVVSRPEQQPERLDLRRLEEAAGRLTGPMAWPPELAPLGERLRRQDPVPPGWPFRQRRASAGGEMLDETIPALVVPLFDRLPDVLESRPLGGEAPRRAMWRGNGRWLVLQLDRRVLAERILPELAERHLSGDGFGLRIVSKASPAEIVFASGRPMPADATIETTADLFGPLFFSRSFRLPLPGGVPPPPEPAAPVAPPEPPEPPTPPRAAAPAAPLQRLPAAPLAAPALPPAPPAAPAPAPAPPSPATLAGDAQRGGSLMYFGRGEEPGGPVELGDGRWRLEVFHEEGSLDLAIDHAQRRNLSVAFGILLVLGLSMLFLARAARRAQELARRQMELVAGVTHELLTPLAAMNSAGQNLRDGVVKEPLKVSRYGELIVKESDRLSDLVGQVLLWAGLSSHEAARSHRETIEARQLIEEALEDLRPALETANFEIALALAPDLPPFEGDKASLRKALGNLIANAVKYGRKPESRPHLQLSARLEKNGRRLAIAVADRGPGIAAEDLPHLFEPFYRGRKVVASNLAGAGLGLALVRRIAQAHGGELRAGGVPGAGAVFTLFLPLPAGGPAAEPAR